MLGYRMRNGQYYIIPEEAEIVRRIYREYLGGWGPNRIAAGLTEDGMLHFQLADGSVVTRIWADRSRAESWTSEKREAARQQACERRRSEWQEQSQ